jgi:hypothetical protein
MIFFITTIILISYNHIMIVDFIGILIDNVSQ